KPSFALPALEDELGRAEYDAVAVLQHRAVQPFPVDLDSVRRAEVDDPEAGALLLELRVPARHVRVEDLDVALLGAADDDLLLRHLVARPVDDERDLLRLETELFERDRLGVGR